MARSRTIIIEQRPFAIHPVSKMMLFDGIFIKSYNAGQYLMRVRFPNPDYQNNNVPNLAIFPIYSVVANQIISSVFPVGATFNGTLIYTNELFVELDFPVDVSQAEAGKHEITINAGLAYSYGFPDPNSMQIEYKITIFVVEATFDLSTMTGKGIVPQGELEFKVKTLQEFIHEKIEKDPCKIGSFALPKDLILNVNFKEPYDGKEGPIPFDDPIWKVIAAIIAIIAGLVALAWLIGGKVGWWGDPINIVREGHVDPNTGETCMDCAPRTNVTTVDADPIWGGVLTLAAIATAVALSDGEDPFRKGEVASQPDVGDLTVSESVSVSFDYYDFPLTGTPFQVKGKWQFIRKGQNHGDYPPVDQDFSEQNIHYLTGINVNTIDNRTLYSLSNTNEILITADLNTINDWQRFEEERTQNLREFIPEFYVYGHMRHRETGITKSTIFYDSGRYPDAYFKDNIFTGRFSVSNSDPKGKWDVMVIAQNINNAHRNMKISQRLMIIGGWIYTKNFVLTPDPNSGNCYIDPNWDLTLKLT
ncbi:hypothetical protein LCGC14_1515630 [marine sediment metagenome]|uniref:Uncharacterized protein n=1 Tax=marine sediment metagenome TaxID=412755 RepID=A0A0F9M189_9ZZZZ